LVHILPFVLPPTVIGKVTELPSVLLVLALSFLPFKEVNIVGGVNRLFRRLATAPSLLRG
jgi:hypothetical protein